MTAKEIQKIKIIHGALDEFGSDIILRGVIAPETLHLIQTGDYQREILPLAKIGELVKAYQGGSVPDVVLGVRGMNFDSSRGGNTFYISHDTYVIDGLQRITAAMQLMRTSGGKHEPRVGAMIHFGTTEEWERERFRILNADRTKLSPNVLLRNLRYDVPALEILFTMSTADHYRNTPLHGRASWQQHMRRNEIITALTLLKVAGMLHAHLGPGRSSRIEELAPGVQKIMENIGERVFRDNVRAFFDFIETHWGIRRIAFKGAVHMRSTFLLMLAQIFSAHYDFWRDPKESRLFIEAQLARKIALFPLNDPQVANLTSASGKARDMLFLLMVQHINSGKRTKRLHSRRPLEEEAPAAVGVANTDGNGDSDGEGENEGGGMRE